MNGFNLKTTILDENFDCLNISSDRDLFYYFLNSIKDHSKNKSSNEEKCLKNNEIKQATLRLLKYKRSDNYKDAQKKKRRHRINEKLNWSLFKNIIRKTNSKLETNEFEKLFKSGSKIKNDFLRKIVELNLFLKNKKQAAVKRLVKEIVFLKYYYFILKPLGVRDAGYLNNILNQIISETKIFIDENDFFIFNKHLNMLFPEMISIDYDWSLQEIRTRAYSAESGLSFAPFWVKLLRIRANIGEIRKYIQTYFVKLSYMDEIDSSYYLLSYLPVIPEIIKSKMLAYYKQRSDLKEIELSQLTNKDNKSFIKNKILKIKKPLFVYQRDLYLSLLRKGVACEFSIYQLMKLGDYNLKYFLCLMK